MVEVAHPPQNLFQATPFSRLVVLNNFDPSLVRRVVEEVDSVDVPLSVVVKLSAELERFFLALVASVAVQHV